MLSHLSGTFPGEYSDTRRSIAKASVSCRRWCVFAAGLHFCGKFFSEALIAPLLFRQFTHPADCIVLKFEFWEYLKIATQGSPLKLAIAKYLLRTWYLPTYLSA